MNISCKLTATILLELDSRGEDLCDFLSLFSIPEPQLRDPAAWLSAVETENFLNVMTKFPWRATELHSLSHLASTARRHRSWGILDSVLRMMSRPQEMWTQPTRLLTYFFQTEHVLEKGFEILARTEETLTLKAPFSSEELPLTCEFLRLTFEQMPCFINQAPAHCSWVKNEIKLDWSSQQNHLLSIQDEEPNLSPQLLQDLLTSLEHKTSESDFENKKNTQLDFHISSEEIRQDIAKLSDYWTRAQQLIVMLIGQNRMSPAVQEAMRKVNWATVQTEFPRLIEKINQSQPNLNLENNRNLHLQHQPYSQSKQEHFHV